VLDQVYTNAAQFTNPTKDSYLETLVQLRTIASLYEIFKACSRERSWKALCDRLRRPYCLISADHVREI
jgi:hypothetical protein